MRIRFWGVRGSLPAPQLPAQIKSKISAILERVTLDDFESPQTRERFLANLPEWLFGTVGGNTPCLEVRPDTDNGDVIILDAGSGIRELGISADKERIRPDHYHIFFSHFHWDHLMGLPFFGPAYDPSVKINFYSPKDFLEQKLRGQMAQPYFPISLDAMTAEKQFTLLNQEHSINVDNLKVSFKRMNHPGDSFSYLIDDGSHKMLYATDTELSSADFEKTEENCTFFQDLDVIILDSQYTLGEAIEKYNWGHSAFSLAVDFAANWGIKHLVLFHHDPTYDDRKLFNNLQSARWYKDRIGIKGVEISLAMEGMEILL
ncbi:MAG: MBL fold metallo-hydrolase [Treponema sp.]|jgi:phosphoribosyl 1,2-cyclic phosphodiesterase|nr:MBL fold metallo-hydrolase [Treponema sp.]